MIQVIIADVSTVNGYGYDNYNYDGIDDFDDKWPVNDAYDNYNDDEDSGNYQENYDDNFGWDQYFNEDYNSESDTINYQETDCCK